MKSNRLFRMLLIACAAQVFSLAAHSANVLFVSDSRTDTNIPAILTANGHTVTTVVNDFTSGPNTNAVLTGSLAAYSVVVWSATGAGFGNRHAAATATALTNWVTSGGRLFVTGYDSTASPSDPVLWGLLGVSSAYDDTSNPRSGPVINVANSLTTGLVDIRGVTPSGAYSDQDSLGGLLVGTICVVPNANPNRLGECLWTLRTLGSGQIAYVSNGAHGEDSLHASWANTSSGGLGAYNAALRNFVFGAAAPPPPIIPIPIISLSTNSIDFGNQNVGTPSATLNVTITNSGQLSLNISSVTGVGDFGFSANCPATLVPDASCLLSVTFTPLSAGLLAGRISVNSNAGAGDSGISLSGTGVFVPRANIAFNPASVNFGDQAVGSTSATQTLFISNTGQVNLELRSLTLTLTAFNLGTPVSADNPRNHPACAGGMSIVPSTCCALGISFAPADVLAITGSLTITHNATPTGVVGTSNVSLAGNGTPRREPLIRVSAGLNFGEQVVGTTSAPQSVTLTNSGTINMIVSGVSVTPTNASTNATDFTVAAAASCGTLIPNANCILNVSFTPSAPFGAKAARLNINSNATNASAGVVSLLGTALPLPVPVVQLSATSIGFGTVIFGGEPVRQRLTVTNVGIRPLVISGMSVTGDYAQTHTCSTALQPNQSCEVSITLAPQSLGQRDGILTINSNAPSSPDRVSLSGNGCALLSLSPSARRFFIGTSCSN